MTAIPLADSAVVPDRKLTHYLLDLDHPHGGSKAVYFRGMGFDEDNTHLFESELLRIANQNDVVEVSDASFGRYYVVIGQLNGPSRSGKVKTVWIVPPDSTVPRFVTAYPEHD